ncbi:MAG: Rpn family recombination-promoting nuclease/putative transposase [Selenomonadaceae bacterium]|nr:Rpn family recombination-promoting nuclease/putative transposase [Selenomonadaceae bacterium]
MRILNLNRMNDALFKNIFMQNSDITLSLINSVFEFQGTALITDIEFIDRNLDAEEDDGKESRLDLLGRSPDGTVINLEIQVAKQEYMGRRSFYYWSRLYNELKSDEEYTELKRTVTINILDFNLFEKKKYPSYHSCFGIYDLKTGNQLTTDCELHFLELPKWHLKRVKETNRLERWLSYFSKKTTVAELEEIAMLEPAIQKAFRTETIFTQDEINRRRYELREKNQRDRIAQINYAVKQAVTQAVTEEREKYAQEEEKRVVSWIKKGKSFEDIMDFTSLTSERVQQLFAENRP